jgi:hypothetical protein
MYRRSFLKASARTLDAREPVKKPQTQRAREIKDHLPDFCFQIILCGCFHMISLGIPVGITEVKFRAHHS